MTDASAFDVFVSYSHKDKSSADAVCSGLESAGIRCWIAPRDIEAGSEWAEGIIHGLNRCRVMVLIFSAHANHSHQVRREVERAVNREMAILPFRIEDVPPGSKLEYFLSNLHWLDALTPPLTAHIERLTTRINSLLNPTSVADMGSPMMRAVRAAVPRSVAQSRAWLFGGGAAALAVVVALSIWLSSGRETLPERDHQVIALAETIRNDINTGALDEANKAMTTLLGLAASNGHTYYFAGELQRVSGPGRNIYKTIDWFVRYMDDPRSEQVLSSTRLDEKTCYETADGFCRQRTAWIGHLLANIYYRLSLDATLDAGKRAEFLHNADQYVQTSLKFYPKGFQATVAPPTQLVDNAWSSAQLAAMIRQRMASP
jgi:hypothetical protein